MEQLVSGDAVDPQVVNLVRNRWQSGSGRDIWHKTEWVPDRGSQMDSNGCGEVSMHWGNGCLGGDVTLTCAFCQLDWATIAR
uniref:Uncharacterized protein n=1 Tax=Romanomermis culicivorax TaxID=13658 RepID=A0A915ILN7_ROMCU